jgi:hypothetical protein
LLAVSHRARPLSPSVGLRLSPSGSRLKVVYVQCVGSARFARWQVKAKRKSRTGGHSPAGSSPTPQLCAGCDDKGEQGQRSQRRPVCSIHDFSDARPCPLVAHSAFFCARGYATWIQQGKPCGSAELQHDFSGRSGERPAPAFRRPSATRSSIHSSRPRASAREPASG